MRIIYCGDSPEVYVVALNDVVPRGVAIEVDDDLGRSLCEQVTNWQQVPDAEEADPEADL
jgi:hypothetical protein